MSKLAGPTEVDLPDIDFLNAIISVGLAESNGGFNYLPPKFSVEMSTILARGNGRSGHGESFAHLIASRSNLPNIAGSNFFVIALKLLFNCEDCALP